MKKLINRILSFDNNKKKSNPNIFKTSGEYWENRYKKGGNSGAGSYNELAEFKAKIINYFVQNNNINSVIEFGCGDGNQLKYLQFNKYTGYDVSEKAIEICSNLYKDDNTKKFKLMTSYSNEKADLTLSLDVIFHLVEDQVFFNYMNNLFQASKKYIIIYSSNTDNNESSAIHVKHRRFTDWIEKNQKSYKLLNFIPNKYSFDGDESKTSFADFYVYEKIGHFS